MLLFRDGGCLLKLVDVVDGVPDFPKASLIWLEVSFDVKVPV